MARTMARRLTTVATALSPRGLGFSRLGWQPASRDPLPGPVIRRPLGTVSANADWIERALVGMVLFRAARVAGSVWNLRVPRAPGTSQVG